jgi:hypothetical protein
MARNVFFLCLGFLVSFRCTIVPSHDINVKHSDCFIFTKQQPFWVSFLPLTSVKVLLYHLKAKKVAKIQAKKVAKIQAKMDTEIQGKKNAEIQHPSLLEFQHPFLHWHAS